MGTNYYWHEKEPCGSCTRDFEAIHIGKSSGGWCFGLHVDAELGIHSLADWKERFAREGSFIKNEYNERVSVNDMLTIITGRTWARTSAGCPDAVRNARQETDEWYRQNHAQPGPNGLARAQIMPGHCIGHGEGTWDLIVGEFS